MPPFRSSQIYEDTSFTRFVNDISEIETGDILGVCEVDRADFYGVHVGLAWIDDQRIRIIHNARHIGQMQIQDIEEVLAYEKHARVAWIKRPIVKSRLIADHGKLAELGLGYLI